MVKDGRFRADLYQRIKGLPFTIPPLRERKEDIAAIAAHALAQRGLPDPPALSQGALIALHDHDWPGNVRELIHLVDAAADLTDGDEIEEATVRQLLAAGESKPKPRPNLQSVDRASDLIEDYEKSLIAEGLRRADGKIKKAARLMGFRSPMTFRRKAIAYGLLPKSAPRDPEEPGEG